MATIPLDPQGLAGRARFLVDPDTGESIPLSSLLLSGTVVFVRINATGGGVSVLVAPVTGKKVRVLGYAFTSSIASIIDFEDDAATILGGPFDLTASGGVAYAGGLSAPAMETAQGKGLNLNSTAASNVRGHLTYILV